MQSAKTQRQGKNLVKSKQAKGNKRIYKQRLQQRNDEAA